MAQKSDAKPLNSEFITITKKEYDELKSDSDFLKSLEAAGVDNWQGYGDAQDIYEKEFENNA